MFTKMHEIKRFDKFIKWGLERLLHKSVSIQTTIQIFHTFKGCVGKIESLLNEMKSNKRF